MILKRHLCFVLRTFAMLRDDKRIVNQVGCDTAPSLLGSCRDNSPQEGNAVSLFASAQYKHVQLMQYI